MINKNVLNTDCQFFINNNLNKDINKLLLGKIDLKGVTKQEIANQILAKKKSEKKLPTWFTNSNIIYPSKISIEQTSSEIAANFKSELIGGKSLIDLTGGFGVDAFYFSKKFDEVFHCEINEKLSHIVSHNFKALDVKNIETIIGNGISYIQQTDKTFDCIYIDPSRRNENKGKVFLLKDCLPNVPENIDLLFSKSDTILIKNSPILDISSTIKELKYVKTVYIVAINNEVKELLFLLKKDYKEGIKIHTCNLKNKSREQFSFVYQTSNEATYHLPINFLYEPNAAILKSGGFNEVSNQLKLLKLHNNTHLYTSKELADTFPGRTFQIEKYFKYNKKQLKKEITETKANITTRNFPKSVAELRKETKLKDGGDVYLFFTKDLDNTLIVLKCKKINSK
ncbi:Thump_like domain-containing protein [Tenacibaculum sp. 190524A02b]|uniref:Thump_like domain-containing protein n=1 Tax=Tenacibaculum vairaonense TaxID=3137860 RepID=A0ABP1FD92_9FLAO